MITEMIFLGRDNENELIIGQIVDDAETAPDFSGVTRMVLQFPGSETVVDSNTTTERINWSADGHISLRLGDLDIEPSKYMVTLTVYDPLHDDGQVIFHAAEGRVQFWFITD